MNYILSFAKNPILICGAFMTIAISDCVAQTKDLFSRVEGQWGWLKDEALTCNKYPHTITFVDGRSRAKFETKAPALQGPDGVPMDSYFYRVLDADKNSITMRLENEARRSKSGELVAWVLILKDENTYVWRQTDWATEKTSGELVRCGPTKSVQKAIGSN